MGQVRSRAFGPLRLTLVSVLGVLASAGCATLPDAAEWGHDATVAPGWARVRAAAVEAVESPRFWGPLTAAAVFQIDGWDHKVSTWARERTPIFGSTQSAIDWSDRLRSAAAYAYVASVLATPSGDQPREWLLDKVRGTAVGLAAVVVTDEESTLIKNVAGRERPNGQDDQSMPSSHTSRAAVLAQLAERNLDSLELTDGTRRVLDAGLEALTYSTAWARVEAGMHFPADTLVGMSLGNWNGAFFNDAFMGLAQPERVSFAIAAVPRGAALCVRLAF